MKPKSPVYNVVAVPVSKIKPNSYNPNAVAPPEMVFKTGVSTSI